MYIKWLSAGDAAGRRPSATEVEIEICWQATIMGLPDSPTESICIFCVYVCTY